MNDEQRQALANAIDMQMTELTVEKDGETLQVGDRYDIAIGVIEHLWQRADDPEVVEAVDSICMFHGMSRTDSEGLIETLMQALIGPRATEQENDNGTS